jgi:uncharacterized membrane protein YdjX (TVP38/TMEM64 family)
MNNELETRGLHTSPEEPGVGRYIAIGLLLSFLLNFIILAYIMVSGNTRLFSFVIAFTHNYAPGAIPNSDAGEGWTSGPLLFLFMVLGIGGGWVYYYLKKALHLHFKNKKRTNHQH